MSPQDKCTLSFYRDLEPMGKSDKVVLVRHIESGQIFVKKRLSAYSREMYRFLQGKDFVGVPHVYECLDDEDCIVVIEEYVPGLTLRKYMDEQGPLPEPRAKQLIEALCDILVRLHGAEKPVVCRDLKPENVILTKDDRLVIVDFDAAKFVSQEKVDTVLLGTPGYAAPEQFGFAASDERTDVYAVGVLLNEMLTGALPQEKTADGAFGRVVRRSTSLDPKERHGSIADFRLDLNGQLRDRAFGDRLLRDGSYEPAAADQSGRRFLPPGFRTRTWWKMIIAIIGYSCAIFMAIMFFIGIDHTEEKTVAYDMALGILWTLLFCWNIAYLFDYLGIRRKMPAQRIKSPFLRFLGHIVTLIIGYAVVLFIAIMVNLIGDIR
jgi:serine/threonine protein kinase